MSSFNDMVLRNFSYGLFVLTAKDGDKDNGCIINTAIQAASDPLTVSICVNKANYTHDMIVKTGLFNVSFLSEKTTFGTFTHFGFQSGRNVDKMADIPVTFKRSENGLVYITDGTNAYISCKVKETMDLGSHTMFIAEILEGDTLDDAASCTYAYYFASVKPKPEAKQEEKKGWICTICGYIYEGDPLPEDFVCPICKHPASDFKPL